MAIDPHCIPCEKNDCWIEIDVRDEHNRSFKGQKATLTDATGTVKKVTLKDGPVLVKGLAVGSVEIKFETKSWLKTAQSREALKEGESTDVPAYTSKLLGHCDVSRTHIRVTSGDLCMTAPEPALPEGHLAGQAQPPRFITKKSYVIEVKGYQLTTLRIGVFFDGTANNTFKHLEGLEAIEAFLSQCDDPKQREKLRRQCISGQLPVSNTSESNDITNIGKAYSLYIRNSKDELSIPVYIDGIGTAKNNDDSMNGQGFDMGETSSLGKVEEACNTQVVLEIKKQLGSALSSIECISRIEFDVFGFSRGASAARQFVNLINQEDNHLLSTAISCEPAIRLSAGFDWTNRDNVRVKFLGIFDTVVTSQLIKRNVTLTQESAERVVHLVANDEWRMNFASTRISDDVVKGTIPDNFTEVILPGSHSDLGGGYYSRWSLRNQNIAEPALIEQKPIKLFQSMEATRTKIENSKAYQLAIEYAKEKCSQGWANGIKILMTPRALPSIGKLNLQVNILNRPEFGLKKPLEISVIVILSRVVEGEYSRIPLHIMVEAARDAGVPFSSWYSDDKDLRLDSLAIPHPDIDLSKLDKAWVDSAKERGAVIDLSKNLSDSYYKCLRFQYLHYSSDASIVNATNYIKGNEERRLISNLAGGK